MNKIEPTLKLVRENAAKSNSMGVMSSKKSSASSGKPLDRVTLSEVTKNQDTSKASKKDITSEIRHDLVNKFRNVLRDGTYSIKADEIADKIVQKIRDNKNHLVM
jgi:anti-sigma28 factor (negative regulator of flagellin synthesis)